MAFLFKQSSMASFVLYFLKEGSAQEGFYKKVKTKEACGVPFKQGSKASFVLTFLKEGSAQDAFLKRIQQRRPVAFRFKQSSEPFGRHWPPLF